MMADENQEIMKILDAEAAEAEYEGAEYADCE